MSRCYQAIMKNGDRSEIRNIYYQWLMGLHEYESITMRIYRTLSHCQVIVMGEIVTSLRKLSGGKVPKTMSIATRDEPVHCTMNWTNSQNFENFMYVNMKIMSINEQNFPPYQHY